jgi:integrase
MLYFVVVFGNFTVGKKWENVVLPKNKIVFFLRSCKKVEKKWREQMPRVKQKINLQTLKNCAKKTGLTIIDTDFTGFFVRIGATKSTYYLKKRVKGKLFEEKIGNYPPMMPEEARREALSMLGKLANYETPEAVFSAKMPKLKEAFEWYINKSRAKNKSHYRSILRHFASIEDVTLGDLQRDQVMHILNSLKSHPSIYNNALTYLSGAFSGVCRENGLTLSNPCAGLRKIAQKPRERYLTEDEAPRLLQELERMTQEATYSVQAWAILMLVYTGARKSEVLSMNLKDIRNGIWVIDKDEYKTGRDFVQELNEDALAIIKERTPYAIDGYLFCRNGARLQDIRRTFHTACLRTDIEDCHPHDLRRTLGTWMLSNGAPIEVVSETLGHSSIRITEQVYAKLLPKKVANATSAAIRKMRGE